MWIQNHSWERFLEKAGQWWRVTHRGKHLTIYGDREACLVGTERELSFLLVIAEFQQGIRLQCGTLEVDCGPSHWSKKEYIFQTVWDICNLLIVLNACKTNKRPVSWCWQIRCYCIQFNKTKKNVCLPLHKASCTEEDNFESHISLSP